MNAGRLSGLLTALFLGALVLPVIASAARADTPPTAAPDPAAGTCDSDAGPCAPMTVKQLFDSKCASCHGVDAKAKTKYGIKHKIPNFTTKRWQTTIEDTEIAQKIKGGVTDKGKRVMPPFKDKLAPDQIAALTVYLRNFGP
jgi:mono/diheme cytochrome c family protein